MSHTTDVLILIRTAVRGGRTRQGVAATAVAVVGLVCMAGCQNEEATGVTDPQPTAVSSGPVATATPSASPDPNKLAARQAKQLVVAYNQQRDRARAKPHRVTRGQLTQWLTDPELTKQVKFGEEVYAGGTYTNGAISRTFKMRATKVSLPADGTGVAEVSIRGCYDVGDLVVYNRDGQQILANRIIRVGKTSYKVVNRTYPSSDGWRISQERIPGQKCRT